MSRPEPHWTAIDEDVGFWTAEYRVPGMPVSSTAIRLDDGGFLVVSPAEALIAPFKAQLDGDARFLLAPNSYHHMGLKPWRAAFPKALAVAARGAQPRLSKQGHQALHSLDELRAACPEHVEIVEVPSTRVGETWVVVKTASGVAWVVCDAFFNMQGRAKNPAMRALSWLLKSAPGLRISGLMKWGGLRDRKVYRAWLLHRLETDAPTILVPGHGDVIRDANLPARLRALIDERL